jgi:signal transduction histidine kinase
MAIQLPQRRILSSFWLWFTLILIINQALLFIAIRFFLIKPPAEIFADSLLMMNDAIQQIRLIQGDKGLDELVLKTKDYGSTIEIVNATPEKHAGNTWYPGIGVIQSFISKKSDGKLSVDFEPIPGLSIWLSNTDNPDFILKFSYKGQPFTRNYLGWALLLTIILSSLAAWWIARRITKPIYQLSDQAHNLVTNAEFNVIKIDPNASYEIKKLSEALNYMRSELDRAINDRENLLAAVTHDLRTPLSRLQIALEMLEPNQPDAIKTTLEDVSEMRMILEQFVELSKLNAEIDESWSKEDLNTFVRKIRDQYRRVGINLRAVLQEQPSLICCKPIALTRLIYNLVDNAYRHGTGNIEIIVTHENQDVLLQVVNQINDIDHETGLTHSLAENTGKIPTTGLGLRIIQKFAQVHHAELEELQDGDTKIFSLRFKAVA